MNLRTRFTNSPLRFESVNLIQYSCNMVTQSAINSAEKRTISRLFRRIFKNVRYVRITCVTSLIIGLVTHYEEIFRRIRNLKWPPLHCKFSSMLYFHKSTNSILCTAFGNMTDNVIEKQIKSEQKLPYLD